MTTAPTPLHQECTDFATSLRSASSVAMTTKGAAPPSFLRAADLFECAAAELRRLQAENARQRAAERTLQRLGYQDRGGQEWAPPIGKAPDFDLIDSLRARITELEGKIGRFQGVPLPLIEAINAATGRNDWQGDHSPAELLGPACRAITALVERKNACIHKLEMDALGLACENSILKRQDSELEARKRLTGLDAMRMGMEVARECRGHATGTTNWATAMTRAYERRLCGITGESP